MPHLKLLGTAAGGGFPQWNCACSLCALARIGVLSPRLQLQAALSGDGDRWTLLNASPDLRVQIESTPSLQPSPQSGSRNTPIQSIILTTADLDQVLGLLLLREFQPLTVYATAPVRQTLEANTFFRMLHRVPAQLTWIEITPNCPFPVSSFEITPIPLPGTLPFYADDRDRDGAAIGLLLQAGGKRIAYTPALPEITPRLKALYETCDQILIDGTFYSDAELTGTHAGTPLARAIGHVPLGGPDGSLALLADLRKPKKLLVHLNNTNPILDPRTPEHAAVIEAGWTIPQDGWQLTWS